MRNLFGEVLWKLSEFFHNVGLKFEEFADKVLGEKDLDAVDFALRNTSSFTTFAEGLANKSYTIRHDAAAKLVSWYVDQQGQPMLDDLIKAARVLLEDTNASEADVSYLVGAWKDQASATTPENRAIAEERETKIYSDLASKLQTKN